VPKDRELKYLTINFDGSLQLQVARAGILVTSPKGEIFKYVLQMYFSPSNNAVTYEALIHSLRIATALGIAVTYEALLHSLRIATALGIHRLIVLGDSLLIINQINKEWSCLDDKMLMYCQELCRLENNFDGLEYLHIL
jgi:ribonuclease HI